MVSRVRCTFVLAAAVATGLACLSGGTRAASAAEPKRPPESKDEPKAEPKVEPRVEPVCRVRLVDERGFELSGALLAFEDGTYRVRAADENEIELPEEDVRSVRFSPLRDLKPRPPKMKPPKHSGRPDYAARPGPERKRDEFLGGLVREIMAKSWEKHRRLSELQREGRLDEHIRKLSSDLRDAGSVKDAGRLLAELRMAHNVKRQPLASEKWRELVNSIADPVVRAQTTDIARRLARPGGPPPRRGPGEWRGPRRRPPAP